MLLGLSPSHGALPVDWQKIVRDQKMSFNSFAQWEVISKEPAWGGKIEVFEGLPHQLWEADQLKKEKETKPKIELHGFPFYKNQMVVKDDDRKKLTELIWDRKSNRPFGGFKLCGGFHPDFLVRFTKGESVVSVQLCYGCGEVRVFAGDRFIYNDRSYRGGLREFMKQFEKERPKQ